MRGRKRYDRYALGTPLVKALAASLWGNLGTRRDQVSMVHLGSSQRPMCRNQSINQSEPVTIKIPRSSLAADLAQGKLSLSCMIKVV